MNKLLAFIPASWRTTLAGIALILTALGGMITALTDNNPETTITEAQIIEIVTGFGFLVARDNKVSSEKANAK